MGISPPRSVIGGLRREMCEVDPGLMATLSKVHNDEGREPRALPAPPADLEREEGQSPTSNSSSGPPSTHPDLKTYTSAPCCPPWPGPPRNITGVFPLQEAGVQEEGNTGRHHKITSTFFIVKI